MKRFVSLLAMSCLLAVPVLAMQLIVDTFPHTDNPTLAKAGLHGPVKTVRSYTAKGRILMEELTFDIQGRLVKEMSYHANTGELLWTHLYHYNEAGLLAYATSSGEYVKDTGARCTFEYDEKGQLLTLTTYDAAGKPLRKRSLTYDARGRKLTEDVAKWNSEEQQWRVVLQDWHRYNEHGDKIEWRYGGPARADATIITTTYQYAPDGAILRRESNWSDGQQKSLSIKSEQGKPLEYLYIPLVVPGKFRTGNYRHERYTYAGDNLVKLASYNEQGQLIYRREYDYNTAGRIIEERIYNSSPGQREPTLSSTLQYLYDEKGQKIEETDFYFLPGQKERSISRKLQYRYNERGQKIEETLIRYVPVFQLTMHPKGKKAEAAPPKPTGKTDIGDTLVYHWIYDAYGNLIEEPDVCYVSRLGVEARYWEYTYFEQ